MLKVEKDGYINKLVEVESGTTLYSFISTNIVCDSVEDFLFNGGIPHNYFNKVKDYFEKVDNSYEECEVIVNGDSYLSDDRFTLRGKNLPRKVIIYGAKNIYDDGIVFNKYYKKAIKAIKEGHIFKRDLRIIERFIEDGEDAEGVLTIGLSYSFRSKYINNSYSKQRELAEKLIRGTIGCI